MGFYYAKEDAESRSKRLIENWRMRMSYKSKELFVSYAYGGGSRNENRH